MIVYNTKMSTFKFNFSGEDASDAGDQSDKKENIQWLESWQIFPGDQINKLDQIAAHAKMFTCGDVEIGHVMISTITSQLDDNDFSGVIKLAEKEHSDLVTAKYEGGLKIWECTGDIIEYFEENNNKISFDKKQVLDLGCGVGILGIYAFINGGNVTFQDYNKEVIGHATIPNVLLNIEEDERESKVKRCKFYTGDWASFDNKCDDVFDIILTSETIYNECNYDKILKLFVDRLKNDGVAYVAAKTYYFGVGGGTRQFEQSIKNNGSLESEVCWKSSGGIQREILKVTKKIQST